MTFFKQSSSSGNAAKKAKHDHEKVKMESSTGKNKVKMIKSSTIQSATNKNNRTDVASPTQPVALSKSVMGMKFMQRQPAAEESKQKIAEKIAATVAANTTNDDSWFRTDHFTSEHNNSLDAPSPTSSSRARSKTVVVSDSNGKSREISVVSARDEVDVYARLPGRRSFNGCNRAVEKYYQQIIDSKYIEKQSRKEERTTEKDIESGMLITDEDMAERYEELIGLPRGPNQGKRAKPQQKSFDSGKKQHKGRR